MRKLAAFCIRHRRLTVLGWVVALVLVGAAAGSAGEKFATNFQLPDSDSTKALNLLEDRFPKQSGDQIQVVFADDAGLEQAAAKSRIADLVDQLRGLDHVVSVAPESEWAKIYAGVDLDRVGFSRALTGYGHYHERYVRTAEGWRIAAQKLTRLQMDFD